jgi:hypothetical protein
MKRISKLIGAALALRPMSAPPLLLDFTVQ